MKPYPRMMYTRVIPYTFLLARLLVVFQCLKQNAKQVWSDQLLRESFFVREVPQ